MTPKEDLFQIGSSTFNMAMSYHRILGDHLADHLIYLSSSSSFWFSLNSSYEHDFHLFKRLGMMPKDYEYLLVAANLAHVDKRWGFSIKMMKWRLFLEGHRFTAINCDCTFEVDVRKVDLNACGGSGGGGGGSGSGSGSGGNGDGGDGGGRESDERRRFWRRQG